MGEQERDQAGDTGDAAPKATAQQLPRLCRDRLRRDGLPGTALAARGRMVRVGQDQGGAT